MLPILVQHLPRDRERMGLREIDMAGRLHLTLRQYRNLEAGELHISNDLYERIVELCAWSYVRGPLADVRNRPLWPEKDARPTGNRIE